MSCAGVLLTGGASRRMGCDKATITNLITHRTLAQRTADLLGSVTTPTIELGPALSGLPARPDSGDGPLAALAAAGELWDLLGPDGSVVVVATDLPRLNLALLGWLVGHPSPDAVVPLDRGRLQPLCARYPVSDLRRATALASRGERRLGAWLTTLSLHVAGPDEWVPPAGDPLVVSDADTPDQLHDLGHAWSTG